MERALRLYFDVLCALRSPRSWVRIRAEVPALLIALVLGAGEAVAALTDRPLAVYIGCGAVFISCCSRRARTIGLIFGAGIALYLAAIQPTAPESGIGETAYLAQIESDPRFRKPGGIELSLAVRGRVTGVAAKTMHIQPQNLGRWLCRGVHLPWRNLYRAGAGDWIILRAAIRPVISSAPAASYLGSLYRQGYSATCVVRHASRSFSRSAPLLSQARARLKRDVYSTLGESETSGLVLSMAIGSRDVLSERTEQFFRRAGLAHLLVVSGYQVSLVFYAIFFLIKAVGALSARVVRATDLPLVASIGALLAALVFIGFCGLEISSARAGIAVLLVAVARAVERSAGLYQAIGASLVVLLVADPGCIMSPGAQLTYAALFGIALGGAGGGGKFIQYLRVSVVATFVAGLVGAVWFKQFSIIGMVLNPLIGSIAAIVSCNIGIAGMLLLEAGLDPQAYLLRAVWQVLHYFRALVLWLGELPWIAVDLAGAGLYWFVGVGSLAVVHLCAVRVREALLDWGVWEGR